MLLFKGGYNIENIELMQIIKSETKTIQLQKPEQPISSVAPKYLSLSTGAKKIYSQLVEKIGEKMKLSRLHEDVIGMLAVEIDTWVWANSEIQRKNKSNSGSGYIQKFASGATNITTEMSIRNQALKNVGMLSKKFGLTVRDLKEIGETNDKNQLSLLEQLLKSTAS